MLSHHERVSCAFDQIGVQIGGVLEKKYRVAAVL
jgi:hypothetical protein